MNDRFWLWVDGRIKAAKQRQEVRELDAMKQFIAEAAPDKKDAIANAQAEANRHIEKNLTLNQRYFMVLWPFLNDDTLDQCGKVYDDVKVGDTVAFTIAYKDDECLGLNLTKVHPLKDGKGVTVLPENVKPLDASPMPPSDADLSHLRPCKDTLLLPGKPKKTDFTPLLKKHLPKGVEPKEKKAKAPAKRPKGDKP